MKKIAALCVILVLLTSYLVLEFAYDEIDRRYQEETGPVIVFQDAPGMPVMKPIQAKPQLIEAPR